MTKLTIRTLCMLVALLLVSSAFVCLAETETETVISGYEPINAVSHTVFTETWEYPIVDGERGSGRPIDEGSYVEPHTFDGDKCIYCGYVLPEIVDSEDDDDDDDDDSKPTTTETTTTTTTEETPAAENSFTNAAGIAITKGMPAAVALKNVFTALPADTQINFSNVSAEVADALMAAINNNATAAELLDVLKNFPVKVVDGVECYVVSISYVDANGNTVVENYAFSTADATLVKLY